MHLELRAHECFLPPSSVPRTCFLRSSALDLLCSMESVFNLFRMPSSLEELRRLVRKIFPAQSVYASGKLRKQCSHGLGRRGGPYSTFSRGLVFNIAGTLVPRRSLRPAFYHPSLPTASSAWMVWMWSVRQALRPTVRPRSFIASVLHVVASSFRFALGNGWSGRPPARTWTELVVSFAMHGRKSSPWSSPFSRSWFVLGGPCLPCSTAWACVRPHLGVASILFLSRSVQRGAGHEPALAWRSDSVAELVTVLLVPLACAPPSPDHSLHRRVACRRRVRRRRLLVFPQVQSSPEAAAAEADDGSVQVVVGDSALCWYDSCSATSFLTFPLSLPSTLLFDCVRCHSSGFMRSLWRLPNLS